MKLKKLAIITLLVAAALRFYNFNRLAIFDPESAMSLITSAQLLKEPSLLGQPYFRTTSYGHQLFNSPTFNYVLTPLLLIFNYHPLPIIAMFTLLNLLTGALIYWLFKRLVKPEIALLGSILFLFNSSMVFHSRFIWIIHPFPLFGLITTYLFLKNRKKTSMFLVWIIGLVTGLGIGMDYTFLFWGLPLFIALVLYSPHRFSTIILFIAGGLIGDLPHILFDLRHQFYNLSTLWQYSLETLNNPGQSKILYYHFFPFWPAVALLGGRLLYWISQRNKLLSGLILAGYLILNFLGSQTFSTYEITLDKQMKAAQSIAADKPTNFNVVSLLDYDTRGHILRYLLQYRHQVIPQAIDKYKDIEAIYALAKTNYDLISASNYELNSFYPYKIQELTALDQNYRVYKLYK